MKTVTLTCPICDMVYSMNVPEKVLNRTRPIQEAWPEGSATERESLISGLCADCQKEVFGS